MTEEDLYRFAVYYYIQQRPEKDLQLFLYDSLGALPAHN